MTVYHCYKASLFSYIKDFYNKWPKLQPTRTMVWKQIKSITMKKKHKYNTTDFNNKKRKNDYRKGFSEGDEEECIMWSRGTLMQIHL